MIILYVEFFIRLLRWCFFRVRLFVMALAFFTAGLGAGFYNPTVAQADLPDLGAEAVFFSGLEDIPLMPGLQELPAQGTVFDKPEGRIVEAVALIGDLGRQDILVYYQGTLPQLGWGRVSDTRFFREGETLEIGFSRVDEGDIVRIMVRPVL